MAAAATEYQEVLASVEFQNAKVPVLSNVDPTPSIDADELKQRLIQQMTGSVRWREISEALPVNGIERVVEIGPGNVLTGLIKRTCSNLALENIRSAAELPN
jgi:[acyl-carrier-protein] S-malonyltransferase